MIQKCTVGLTALASLTMVAGCGGGPAVPPVPVSGQVIYNGEPVEDAHVTFHWAGEAQGRSASGKTGSDGRFTLTTYSTGDGAVPGDYVVTVSKKEAKGGMDTEIDAAAGEYGADYGKMMDAAAEDAEMKEVLSDELPEKYADPAESDVKRSVIEGDRNEFTIELD